MVVTRRSALLGILATLSGRAAEVQGKVDFVCPMDPEIHRSAPGRCPRCGMGLVAQLPAFEEYPVTLTTEPRALRPSQPVRLRFVIRHPRTGQPCAQFTEVHEKLFHLFLVSEDLGYFSHEHPELQPDGSFTLTTKLPNPGMFRVLCDFYPKGGQPQMVAQTLIVPGVPPAAAPLAASVGAQQGENVRVSLTTERATPLAGKETLLFFAVDPAASLQPYLGAWGHMLAASSDLIDMIHTHPAIADGGPQLQFNLIFPRPGLYRLWLQVQRAGVVNTVAFTVPVEAL